MKRTVYATRDEWLEARRSSIGASESPGILGHGYASDSAMATYASKVGILDDVIDETTRRRMDIGTAIEPVIRELFTEESHYGFCVKHAFELCVSDERPHVSASLDGVVPFSSGNAVFEAKNVDAFLRHDWDDAPPLRVQIQVQHQMYVTGYQMAYVAALIGGNELVIHEVERDEAFITAMLPALDEFWQFVETKTPPPPDHTQATSDALRRLYPQDDGEIIDLPPEALEWDESLQDLKKTIKEMEEEKRGFENELKACIGDAAYGLLPNGKRYSWKTQPRKGYTVEDGETRPLRRVNK